MGERTFPADRATGAKWEVGVAGRLRGRLLIVWQKLHTGA